MTNQLFIMSNECLKAVLPDMDDNTAAVELGNITADMIECNIFKLPFNIVDFKIEDRGITKYAIKNLKLSGILPTVEVARRMYMNNVQTYSMFNGDVYIHPAMKKHIDEDRFKWDEGDILDALGSALIMALVTKNVEKETTSNKRAKLGIGKKENREYEYITRINLPHNLQAEYNATGRTIKPHLRRGHSRHQHYGQGNEKIKMIFIQPVFVNADDEYVETRKAYKI